MYSVHTSSSTSKQVGLSVRPDTDLTCCSMLFIIAFPFEQCRNTFQSQSYVHNQMAVCWFHISNFHVSNTFHIVMWCSGVGCMCNLSQSFQIGVKVWFSLPSWSLGSTEKFESECQTHRWKMASRGRRKICKLLQLLIRLTKFNKWGMYGFRIKRRNRYTKHLVTR